jgi:hypothetical protein
MAVGSQFLKLLFRACLTWRHRDCCAVPLSQGFLVVHDADTDPTACLALTRVPFVPCCAFFQQANHLQELRDQAQHLEGLRAKASQAEVCKEDDKGSVANASTTTLSVVGMIDVFVIVVVNVVIVDWS